MTHVLVYVLEENYTLIAMSNDINKNLSHNSEVEQDLALVALNEFLDGELSLSKQPELFAHLSVCEECRRELDGVMNFRRLSRVEHLVAPPSMDAALFKRLRKQKSIMARIDRAEDRKPLWSVRTAVSIRATALTVLLVFFMGLFYPGTTERSELAAAGYVTGLDELTEFTDLGFTHWNTRTLYVIYPGLTVEASSPEEAN